MRPEATSSMRVSMPCTLDSSPRAPNARIRPPNRPSSKSSFSAPIASSMHAARKSRCSWSPTSEKDGSIPRLSACSFRMREHMPWMVEIHAASTLRACSTRPSCRNVDLTRALISRAAFSVNVIASTWSMSSTNALPSPAEPGVSAQAIRRVSVKVLPEPAPADMSRGPSTCSMLAFCAGVYPIMPSFCRKWSPDNARTHPSSWALP